MVWEPGALLPQTWTQLSVLGLYQVWLGLFCSETVDQVSNISQVAGWLDKDFNFQCIALASETHTKVCLII